MMKAGVLLLLVSCLLSASEAWLNTASVAGRSPLAVKTRREVSSSSLALHPHQASELAELARAHHHELKTIVTTTVTTATAASAQRQQRRKGLPILGWCIEKIQSFRSNRAAAAAAKNEENCPVLAVVEAATTPNDKNNDPLRP